MKAKLIKENLNEADVSNSEIVRYAITLQNTIADLIEVANLNNDELSEDDLRVLMQADKIARKIEVKFGNGDHGITSIMKESIEENSIIELKDKLWKIVSDKDWSETGYPAPKRIFVNKWVVDLYMTIGEDIFDIDLFDLRTEVENEWEERMQVSHKFNGPWDDPEDFN